MPVLAETAAAVSALSWRRVAGWPLGCLLWGESWLAPPGVSRPDYLGRWLYLGLATNAGSVWLPFRRVGPVQHRGLTASGQPLLAPTPTAIGICRCPLARLGFAGVLLMPGVPLLGMMELGRPGGF